MKYYPRDIIYSDSDDAPAYTATLLSVLPDSQVASFPGAPRRLTWAYTVGFFSKFISYSAHHFWITNLRLMPSELLDVAGLQSILGQRRKREREEERERDWNSENSAFCSKSSPPYVPRVLYEENIARALTSGLHGRIEAGRLKLKHNGFTIQSRSNLSSARIVNF